MNSEIFFNGIRYISANEAASISGLTRDYIARQCREGRIDGKRVGKNWYLENSSFEQFLILREHAASERSETLAKERALEYGLK